MIKPTKLWQQKKYRLALLGLLVVLIVAIGVLFIVLRQSPSSKVAVTQSDYDSALATRQHFYDYSKQSFSDELVRQDVLDLLAAQTIIKNYAAEHEIIISDEQVNNYYMQRVAAYESESALLDQVNSLYGIDKSAYLENIRYELTREAVQAMLDEPLDSWIATQLSDREVIVE